jgi:hypothetical protein
MIETYKFPALQPVPITLMDECIMSEKWGPWMPNYKRPLVRCVCHVVLTVPNDSGPDTLTDELLVWDGRCFLKGNVSIFKGVVNWRQRVEFEGLRRAG